MLAPLLSTERPTGVAALPPRQRQILRRLGSGQSTKEIAAELGISAKTVETHRSNLLKKLGLQNVTDIVRLAIREGLITP